MCRFMFVSGLRVALNVLSLLFIVFFFFQAEDGIRYLTVTGVQTCALPICPRRRAAAGAGAACRRRGRRRAGVRAAAQPAPLPAVLRQAALTADRRSIVVEIGRASCRERV